MCLVDSFGNSLEMPQIETGFYFARNQSGSMCVRILHDQIYFITKASEMDDSCYDEYVITDQLAFISKQRETFIKVKLAAAPDLLLFDTQDIYIHPDCFEYICYWPKTSAVLSLSLQPDDISEYWSVEHETPIDDPRIMHVTIHDTDGYLLDGRYHINKAYLRRMIEEGQISSNAHIAPAESGFDINQLYQDLRGDNHSRARRFEIK